MPPVYKNVAFRFDDGLWADFCKVLVEKHGLDDIAEMIEVHPHTLRGWIKRVHKAGFEHPSMSNFLALCALADVDPGQFFTIQDRE